MITPSAARVPLAVYVLLLLPSLVPAGSLQAADRTIDVASYPVIFASDDHPDGASTHLPSLLVTNQGTAIAVCQFRKKSVQDWAHDIDLLLRRSRDGGRTWEPECVLFSQPGVNTVNGEIVQDRSSGEILLPFTKIPSSITTQAGWVSYLAQQGGSLWYISSKDDGASWSAPRELKPKGPHGWTAWPSNSGHGLQLASGRLIIGAFVHKELGPPHQIHELEYCSGLMYSDDHGMSWTIGATAPFNGTDELVITETALGDIYANIRLNNRNPRDHVRLFGRSRDGGQSFAETGLQDNLSNVDCHVGITRWQRDGRDVLLYSGPQGPGGHSARTALTVRLSYDGGRSWPVARKITGPADSSEYSDLAVAPDGAILCLYGENTFATGSRAVIRAVRLTLAQIELDYGPR